MALRQIHVLRITKCIFDALSVKVGYFAWGPQKKFYRIFTVMLIKLLMQNCKKISVTVLLSCFVELKLHMKLQKLTVPKSGKAQK